MSSHARRVDAVLLPLDVCPAIARILRSGLRAEASNGWSCPADALSAVDVITEAGREVAMSARGQDSPKIGESADIAQALIEKEIDTATAAGLLHMTGRHVRRLAFTGQLRGRQVGGHWLLERKAIDEYDNGRG